MLSRSGACILSALPLDQDTLVATNDRPYIPHAASGSWPLDASSAWCCASTSAPLRYWVNVMDPHSRRAAADTYTSPENLIVHPSVPVTFAARALALLAVAVEPLLSVSPLRDFACAGAR
ncbi:hypothetical protein HYPSUDRAFT_69304 [Hypholoma sublateritium FD-334 SS-4]|uniref:Uncharacterized protein n=1 Tax=Hypholoma sublateritium (strain FD-334 SS-4) TaxID=945553 RepID=A0A0D2KXK9_HYPSF|nr:hypothetical protein HYPSUDRAFT_69304 [Hypholoma sublateritium FD-334 SS-4]